MDQTNINLQRTAIKELLPIITNAVVVGIIIAKQRLRRFFGEKDTVKERGVWNFTIRDSIADYINVTCWGDANEIMEAYDKYHMGDVIEIVKPRIEVRKTGDMKEHYCPMVTSPFHLTTNVPSMAKHDTKNYDFYSTLLRHPTKPILGVINLIDVHNSGGSITNFVDLLGAVRTVGSIRMITTKVGNEQQVRDVVIFDHTHPGLKITLWDPELIARASSWRPRTTVLLMTDMKIDWSSFNRSVVASLTSRTIVTENPVGPEAKKLGEYACTVQLEHSILHDQLSSYRPNVDSIQNVMSVQQVLDKIEMILNFKSGRPEDHFFTALLYVLVSQFDLDGFSPVTAVRCAKCKTYIKNGVCLNNFCSPDENMNVEVTFDLKLTLSDHTGSLQKCRLTGRTAENVLNCTVEEFSNSTDDKKATLKWKFLMERCAVKIMVLCGNTKIPLISILDCTLSSAADVATKIPSY